MAAGRTKQAQGANMAGGVPMSSRFLQVDGEEGQARGMMGFAAVVRAPRRGAPRGKPGSGRGWAGSGIIADALSATDGSCRRRWTVVVAGNYRLPTTRLDPETSVAW